VLSVDIFFSRWNVSLGYAGVRLGNPNRFMCDTNTTFVVVGFAVRYGSFHSGHRTGATNVAYPSSVAFYVVLLTLQCHMATKELKLLVGV
jgi:hypothetical protein